ncbi:hypothetical protein [Primorskyibacter sp. S187A]|uniref:hypothetical protein n=1 Tax=Primorskyibacter sp. S187A TaxID=3415130 RepID=UPI003C7BD714
MKVGLAALFLAMMGSQTSGGMARPEICGQLLLLAKGSAQDDAPLLPYVGPAKCATARDLSGQTSHHCHWSFAFRADAAHTYFDTLSAALAFCSETPVQVAGARVNHPDSFDQITGEIAEQSVSLSLKDKGALQQTLVFLRVVTP